MENLRLVCVLHLLCSVCPPLAQGFSILSLWKGQACEAVVY